MYAKISARELADAIDRGEAGTILDTRPADSYEAWRVPGAVNVPFGLNETLDDERESEIADLADGGPVTVICGKAATSSTLAAELDAAGYEDVRVVKGGMRDWNDLYERAEVAVGGENDGAEDGDGDVDVVQFQRRGKGCLSYLVGSDGEAAVVDPARHVEQYVVAAAERGWEITRVLDTHVHADHISGGRELADRLDVPYHLGARAADRVEFEFDPVEDGDVVPVGDVDLTALAAPGHTTEMVAYRVGDGAVLTGDSLFLDSVGRTELEFGEEGAERGAEMAYDTLHDVFSELPDDLTVLPGHVTVESDGRYANGSPGEPVAASLGEVTSRLDLLGLDREAFVERMVENVPEKPANYETVIAINAGREEYENDRDAAQLETGANNCAA
ncbi:rhodanese-like domain-containing protein [Halogeometricum sp. S1BR25-6]|uniref:Rhodanese-like domain-containing protein n=1 Tax=Halogeometricum salsisoli TaxID=2950536 RepID=A0ABU2GC31_9EURY|nr:rhodanese-like domain-containing protein [Halogeometricum sp. S1BR25-6]MDS0297744.1 rhodanese-like domain-containing protein [Halogeometricum sp. S1BR25-6]